MSTTLEWVHAIGDLHRFIEECPTQEAIDARADEWASICATLKEKPTPVPLLPVPASLAGGVRISGYAARWTPDSRGDLVQRGDFANFLPLYRANPALHYAHWPEYPLGRVEHISEEPEGLWCVGVLYPAVEEWQQLIIDGVLAGLIGGMSFSALKSSTWGRDLALVEICIGRHPAHPDSRLQRVEPLH